MDITMVLATEEDREQLLTHFRHYKVEDILERRVDCYLSHNFTVVAKNRNKIVGTLQWHVKEDPKMGVAEFEEIHVLEDYRGRGLGSLIMEFAMQSVRDYFGTIGIKPRKIFLFVNENNEAAGALYEKYGFKVISNVGHLFSDKEKELLYSLDL